MHIERTGLCFGQDRSRVAGLHRAALKDLTERVDPFRFDAIGQHILSPLRSLHHQTSGNPRSRYARTVSSAPLRINPKSEIVISGTNISTAWNVRAAVTRTCPRPSVDVIISAKKTTMQEITRPMRQPVKIDGAAAGSTTLNRIDR